MKRMSVIVLALVLTGVAFAAQAQAAKKPVAKGPAGLSTKIERKSYVVGLDVGRNLKQVPGKIDMKALVKGIEDSLHGKKPQLSEKEIQEIGQSINMEVRAQRKKMTDELAAKNLKEEQKFLAENKAKKGVHTTASGLQYKVLRPGKGPSPTATDKVEVNYEGRLLNGKVFDSSYKRGKPAVFPLNRIIPGWKEGLQLMHVGAKYRFFIPSKLAYGKRGAGGVIPPNALLIFDVELMKIVK